MRTRISKVAVLALAMLGLVGFSRPAFSQARPAITGISHIIVLGHDLNASKHFYGDLIGWPATGALEAGDAVHYQVGERQFIELKNAAAHDSSDHGSIDRVDHIAFQTRNAKAMMRYLAANGITVPAELKRRRDGGLSFMIADPEGYAIEFVQGGHFPAPSSAAVSTHIIHIGFTVRNEAAETHFYQDILGFHLYWQGWMRDDIHKPGEFDFKSYQVPNGTDWVEFMLAAGKRSKPGPRMHNPHHFAPGVVSVNAAYAILRQRGLPADAKKPLQGRDGKMQLNLFDPDGTRVELMNFSPNIKPCCASFTGSQPAPPSAIP